MSYPLQFNWTVPDTQAICLTQSTTGAASLSVNGNLTKNTTAPGNAIFPGLSRTVSLTSTSNLSGVNFTITGVLNGSSVSETRAGPNNNTVETTQIFDSIVSVSVNGAVTNVSVGSGTKGQTHWFKYDYNRSYSASSVQAIVNGTINYTFNITSDDVQTTPSPTVTAPITALTNATGTQFQSFSSIPFNYGNVTINSSNTTGNLIVTIIQTGS